jgi:hypothetical protein
MVLRWWLEFWAAGLLDFAGWRVFALVSGEEARSREAWEYAEMPARHLMPLRAALRTGDAMCTGYGNEGTIHHGPVPLG